MKIFFNFFEKIQKSPPPRPPPNDEITREPVHESVHFTVFKTRSKCTFLFVYFCFFSEFSLFLAFSQSEHGEMSRKFLVQEGVRSFFGFGAGTFSKAHTSTFFLFLALIDPVYIASSLHHDFNPFSY